MIIIVNSEGSWISDGLLSSSRIRRSQSGGKARGGESGASHERRSLQSKSTLESTAPNARSRSREGTAMNEAPGMSRRVSSTCSPRDMFSERTCRHPSHRRRHRCHCNHRSSQRSRGHRHACLQRRDSRVHRLPCCQHQSKRRDGEPRDSKRRCDTMVGFKFALADRDRDPATEG